jgi:hypothetical protein
MAAVSSMILRSQRMIGEKARGETLNATESPELLYELNSMMESWETQRLLCYSVTQESFSLTASTGTYTIGSGGTFNTARPTKIVDPCFVRDSANLDTPVTIIYSEQYGRVVQKSVGYTYPTYLYYDMGFSATSTGTINLFPLPSGSLTLFINSWKQLQNFASVSTQVLLPPGYQLAIESNFAIHLAAGLTPISQELAKIAKESLAAVRSLNLPATISRLDYYGARQAGTSILTGP